MKHFFTTLFMFIVAICTYGQSKFPDVKPLQPRSSSPAMSAQQAASTSAVQSKTLYCGLQTDLLRRRAGLATFDLADPMNSLTIVNNSALTWNGDTDYDSPIAGAWAKGKYYTFIGKVFTFVTERKYWGTFDLETGDFTKIANAQPSPTFNNEAQYADYSPVYSMAYDNKNDKMYALYYDVETYTGGYKNCVLATVDLKTGVLKKVGEFDKIYYSIAIDYFGKMYGLTYKLDVTGQNIIGTNLYRINDDSGKINTNLKGVIKEAKLVGEVKSTKGDSFVGAALQDMDFDHDAWVIRWNRISEEGTFLSELDPETAVYSNSQLIGSNATVVGIHAPYSPASSADAPGHVQNLEATPASQGAKTVTLTWTNPTTTWDHHNLDAVTEVRIYRGDTKIGTVTSGVVKGGKSSYTDNDASAGVNIYKVVACSGTDKEGVPTEIKTFVGIDAPGAPQNVVLTSSDGKTADIAWEAPAVGKNNGWYDTSTLKYTITRQPDGNVVAKDITDTHFTDNTITKAESYSYTVQASNAAGTGLQATSNVMIIGPAIVPPYSATFTDNQAAGLWTPYDANADFDGWRFEDFWDAWISTEKGNRGDDWLFSPEFGLEKGHSYRVNFGLYKPYHSSGGNEYITFAYGQGATVDAMTNIMAEKVEIANNETRFYSYTITADASAAYTLGLHAQGEDSNWGTYFTSFSINEINPNDLAATAITGPTAVSATANNTYIVTVENKGAKTAAAYSVQLVDDDDNVLGETDITAPLAPQEVAEVKVVWAPEASLSGNTVEVYGSVIYDGDGDASNDNTDDPLLVTVGEASSDVWVDYTGKKEWADASNDNILIPFGFSYVATWSETIYDRANMDLGEGDVTISKISYDYSFGTSVEAKIKVYIGSTDKTSFSSVSELIAKDNLTLVNETTTDISKGDGTLTLSFTKPYVLEAGKNIVIAVDRPYASYNDSDIFDNHFSTKDSTPLMPTLQYCSDKTTFNWTGASSTYLSTGLPVTHFFVSNTTTGINDANLSASDTTTGIYTLDGMKVSNLDGKHGTFIIRSNGVAKKVIK